jgi:glycosyltransferase involved in cell wall biosynthesis
VSSSLPLVTVLINNYNYGQFLAESIESALSQCYPNLEVVVVDDGSLDNSREVIGRYGSRVAAIFQKNAGQAAAFNSGFKRSKGDWILLLDSDDFFAVSKVETLMSYAASFPAAGLIAHNLKYCDEKGEPTVFPRFVLSEVRVVDDTGIARKGKFSVCLPPTSALALRRDVASKIFPMPSDFTIAADNFIQTAALGLAPVLLVPDFLATQRIHPKNSYTRATKTEEFSLAEYVVRARLAYRIKERFPFLERVAWKTYGAIAYRLMASKSKNAKQVRKAVRSEYGLLECSIASFYYVGGGFVAALVRDLFASRSAR